MSKFLFILLHEEITLAGEPIKAGDVVELPERSAQALINEGKAAEATADGDTQKALEDLPPAEDVQKNAEADLEMTRSALDSQYKLDDLKPAAKDAGVEFAYDVKKGDLITAIIEQGKAAELLK